jgi:hypothetical protein
VVLQEVFRAHVIHNVFGDDNMAGVAGASVVRGVLLSSRRQARTRLRKE